MRGSGRIAITGAVVLSRRDYRETDRVAFLYTEDFGKCPVRFIGVNRPRGKLKALSEPMTWAEYRLYTKPGAEFGTVLGGGLRTIFPKIRADLKTTLYALEACELLERLTPSWQPNASKYELITRYLSSLESAGARSWTAIAFALRLLKSAGFGVSGVKVSEGREALWRLLHEADFSRIATLADDATLQHRLESYIQRSVERQIERPLRSSKLRAQLITSYNPVAAS